MVSRNLLLNVPTKSSDANTWIQWHKNLKAYVGKKNANLLFQEAWEKRGSTGIVTNDMQDYFNKQGIQIDGTIVTEITGFVGDVTDSIGSVFSMAKWGAIAVGGVILTSIVIISLGIAKNPQAITGRR